MERILVFIPVYNCENQIKRVLAKFDKSMKDLFSEILIVDNQSKDKTIDVCKKAMLELPYIKCTIVKNSDNYNLGGSHKVAFNYAKNHGFDYVIVLHGDDQGDIRDIVHQIRIGKHKNIDCLLGARFMKKSKLVNYSKFRIFGNLIFNMLFSLASHRRLYDLGSGLNMYKVSFLHSGFYLRFPNALTFNYYMILYTVAIGAKFVFFPLSWREDDQVSNVRLFNQTKKMLTVLGNFYFSKQKFMQNMHEKDREYIYQEIFVSNSETENV